MATQLQPNGFSHRVNGDTESPAKEDQAILEVSVRDDLQAHELSEMLAALSWLHESLAGHPAKVETILIN